MLSGVVDCCIGSSSLLLLPFSCDDFRTSNADATPNSSAMFLHGSHADCLNDFNVVVKHGDIIENMICDASLCEFHLSLFDVILAHASSFISASSSSSLMTVTT